ncbi:MAG: DMT family transporter, partial [Gemmatimonadota bacterium]
MQNSDRPQHSHGLTYTALAGLIFIWASNFSVVKFALRDMSPLAFNGLRFTIASILLYASVRIGGHRMKIERRHWPAIVALGLLGNTLYQVLFIYGIAWTLAGNASLMLATTPVFTSLLSVALKHERIGPSAHAGVALSFVGIVFVVLGGAKAVDFGTSTIAGDLTTLAAAAAHGLDDLGEGSLHVAGLLPLVIRPLEMKLQYGNAPLIDHVGIDLAIAGVVGNHLAAAREPHMGSVLFPDMLLHSLSVAMLAGGTVEGTDAGHAEAAADLD